MRERSIFDGVVRNEDSHTNLLRNLMATDRTFESILITNLLPPDHQNLTRGPFEVSTQVSLGTHGRADMVIRNEELLLIVEVKIDSYCETTPNQRLDPDAERGYLPYLKEQSKTNHNVGIVFIAPKAWNKSPSVRAALHHIPTPVITNFVSWEQVCRITAMHGMTPLIYEFNTFLERSFMEIKLSDADKLLLQQAGPAFSSATRKLHEIVKKSQRELEAELKAIGATGVTTAWGADAHEFGYFLSLNGQRALWIGIWDEAPFPAVVAVESGWKTTSSFLERLKQLNLPMHSHKSWHVFSLRDALLAEDPLRALVSLVTEVVSKRNGQASH